MRWSETRRALRVCGGDARATSAGGNRSSDKCLFSLRKPRFWITRFSSQALCRRRCGVSPGSLTLGRAECSPRDSPRSCRGSRARSASTADARSTPLAPLAPEHACVPAGAVDQDARRRPSLSVGCRRLPRPRLVRFPPDHAPPVPLDTPYSTRLPVRHRRRPRWRPASSYLPRARFPTASASASASRDSS